VCLIPILTNFLDATDDDAEDEIKDDDQLVQIDDVPEPILSRLQDRRISTQRKHEKTEDVATLQVLPTYQEIMLIRSQTSLDIAICQKVV
jgi:hypothetical protein